MSNRPRRRLTAIVAADVANYSRLIGLDEEGTLEILREVRHKIVNPLVNEHEGRIANTAGDSLLIEFPSVVDAVRCSLAVQRSMAERNAGLPDKRRFAFRVGINVGDVVSDGDDLLGDGVNVAARLEGLSDAGGMAISDDAYRQIRGRVDEAWTDAGEHALKNIVHPVRVWRWSAYNGGSNASPDIASGQYAPPPDRPSIAVLPFDNMSGDPEQDFFADGMTEDLITDLSRIPWFSVVARNSTFVYKNRAIDVKAVARELGVRYVLEGSVRKAGNRLRITAQLIDATTGNHVWGERFDREIEDIFAIQDEAVEAIVGAVAPEFLSFEARRAQRKDPSQLDAWECMIRGRSLASKMGRNEVAQARKLFERAVQLAPDGLFGAADLAMVHFLQYYYRWSDDPAESLRNIVVSAEKAVAADGEAPWSLTMLGLARCVSGNWDEALPPIEHALRRNSHFAPAIALKGFIMALRGEVEDALDHMIEARRRSPHDPFIGFWLMGLFWAQYMLGDYSAATETAQEGVRLVPENPTYRRQLAASLAMLGRLDEAKVAIAAYLALEPNHTLADAAKVPTRDTEHLERFLEGLRKAGMPE